jgi:hypothetical protein
MKRHHIGLLAAAALMASMPDATPLPVARSHPPQRPTTQAELDRLEAARLKRARRAAKRTP